MSCNDLEVEYQDITNRNGWTLVFQEIESECKAYQYTCTEARKVANKPLNRYRDVNPFDHTRIVLQRCQRDYINANLLTIERAKRKYILTQGPLPNTMYHFWLMVWERDSRAILMLNKVIEKNETKCHWYWPLAIGPEHKMTLANDNVQLIVEQLSEEYHGYYTTRVFRVEDLMSSRNREVIQFHYTTWPDFGVPSSPVAFLEFLQKVRAAGVLEPDVGPAVVHCSAGIGRSGTFCLVDSCLVLIENEGVENVNIRHILKEMRRDRAGLVQTPDQLRFSYKAIIEGVKRLDPNFKPPVPEENIYAEVADEAPRPPPRGESLGVPPARPLPAIPVSSSLGNLEPPVREVSSSDEEEEPPLPPTRSPPSPLRLASLPFRSPASPFYTPTSPCRSPTVSSNTPTSPPISPTVSTLSGSENEDNDDALCNSERNTSSEANVRRRKAVELAERVSDMKRKARAYERWHMLKRSLFKPITITVGVLLASILVYSYMRH